MTTIHTGRLAHLRGDPFEQPGSLDIIERGALLVDEAGAILAAGDRNDLLTREPSAAIVDHGDAWLLPGLVDGHIHFPQYYATAAPGGQLLQWLQRSIFPAEAAFADAEFAEATADRFVGHLLSCGTTTAMVFGSQFLHANLALFDAAKRRGLRLISGMTLMDGGGPEALLQSPEQAHRHCEALIEHCRGEPMLHYAVTPRFALSCSETMLEVCGDLLRAHPDCYLQTHINENVDEIAAVAATYPWSTDYLSVYERFGLVSARTMLAHDIHVSPAELARIGEAGAAVCHCPASNAYLGSGLFDLTAHLAAGIPVAMGTDIGAGLHFSIWRELSDAYKLQSLRGRSLTAEQLLYLATLGGARALRLDRRTGNFEPGKSADFIVLAADDGYLAERLNRCQDPVEQLFCLMHLATERSLRATYVRGRQVFAGSGTA